jgi:hypothetical protein
LPEKVKALLQISKVHGKSLDLFWDRTEGHFWLDSKSSIETRGDELFIAVFTISAAD